MLFPNLQGNRSSLVFDDPLRLERNEMHNLTHESWMKLEEELRDLHELITTFSATPAVTVT